MPVRTYTRSYFSDAVCLFKIAIDALLMHSPAFFAFYKFGINLRQ